MSEIFPSSLLEDLQKDWAEKAAYYRESAKRARKDSVNVHIAAEIEVKARIAENGLDSTIIRDVWEGQPLPPVYAPEVIDDIGDAVRKMVTANVKHMPVQPYDYYYRTALNGVRFLRQEEKHLFGRVLRNHKVTCQTADSLFNLALEFGTEAQRNKVAEQLAAADDSGWRVYGIDRLEYSKLNPLVDEITLLLKDYCSKYGLDEYFIFSRVAIVNAAMEIAKMDYDLIVPVLRSGVPLALMLEVLGKQVRYIEWHKDWKTGPRWQNMGKDQSGQAVRKGAKILVCENDYNSGDTLNALAPVLKELEPRQVDLCTYTSSGGGSRRLPELSTVSSFYDRHIDLQDRTPLIDESRFYINLKNFHNLLKGMKERGEI